MPPAADAALSMYCFADEEPAGRRAAHLFRAEGLRAGASIILTYWAAELARRLA